MIQFDNQVRMRLTSQLIKGNSRVLQKLLKHFKDKQNIFTLSALSVNLDLNLNDSKYFIILLARLFKTGIIVQTTFE